MPTPFVIVLDPGHGGTSLAEGSSPNNAVGPNGLLEKDLTLAVAKAAAGFLPESGFRVLLTREDDRNLSPRERAMRAREAGADAFVSLHFNGHREAGLDGTEAYVSNAARETDRELARQLLQSVAPATGAPARGLRTGPFAVLAGDVHVPKTAACLVELAFLTNPAQAARLESSAYVRQLGLGVAQGLMGYSARRATAQSLDAAPQQQAGERVVYEATREHEDPQNFPINLPEPGEGQDAHQLNVPDGLKFSRWEVEVLASSAGAGYRVAQSPARGAEGRQTLGVAWWHPPYGKVHYRLRAFASPDGAGSARPILYDSPGWMERAKDQLAQGQGVNVALRGERARQVYQALSRHESARVQPVARGRGNGLSAAQDMGVVSGPTVVLVLGIAAAVVAVILIGLGMLTFGALLKFAMDKGYDIKDTKYKAAAGQGEGRQEHELNFNLFKPR